MLRRLSATLMVLSLAIVGAVQSSSALAAPSAAIPDQYIVVFKDNVADPVGIARALAARHGFGLRHAYGSALKGFAAVIPAARLAQVQSDPNVAYVVQDDIVSLGPIFAKAKPGGGGTQSLPTGINRIDGELSSQISGNGVGAVTNVAVAVIDTGIDLTHPDLNVVGGFNCSTGSSYADGNGHGSHVSGTIGAKDDLTGVVGVAPGVALYAVRVLNNAGSGTRSDVICGIDWVTQNAARVSPKIVAANMSLGGSGSDDGNCGRSNNDPEHTAVCNLVNAGVTLAVAAGNETDNAANHVPAAYDEAITVSALADFNGQPGGGAAATCRTDVDDTFADFSNFGADVDIIAPGVCIYSTWKGGGYNTISGTSMATPHVTGAAALYISTHAGATPAQVKSALQSAGNLNWATTTDPDGAHERLLNVDAF